MRVVSCHRLLYVSTLLRPVSQSADVSSFASKSRTDIIRTRLETCWPHIRSPSLTGSVTHSSQSAGEKIGICWNFQLPETDFYCDHQGFYLAQQSPPATTSTTIVAHQFSPRQWKCNSCTEKAAIFCNKKCHLKVHRNLLEWCTGGSGEDFVSTFQPHYLDQ